MPSVQPQFPPSPILAVPYLVPSVPGMSYLLQAKISAPVAEGQQDRRKEQREVGIQTPTSALSAPLPEGVVGGTVQTTLDYILWI